MFNCGLEEEEEEERAQQGEARRRFLLLGGKQREREREGGVRRRRRYRPWRGGTGARRTPTPTVGSAASLGCCCRPGRGDDAATLLGDGSAGGDHVVPQPGESPRSTAEGR